MAMRTNDEKVGMDPQVGGAREGHWTTFDFLLFLLTFLFFFDFSLFFSSTCLVGLEGQADRAYDAGLAGTARGWSGQQDNQRNGTTNPSMIVPSYIPTCRTTTTTSIHTEGPRLLRRKRKKKKKTRKTTQHYFTPVPWRPNFVLFTILYSFFLSTQRAMFLRFSAF